MKKVIITILILIFIIISTVCVFYIRFLNLDIYKWNTNENIISFKDKQYKYETEGGSLHLEKRIGKIEGEPSFRIWSIKGENIDERIAIIGFMYPIETYRRIR